MRQFAVIGFVSVSGLVSAAGCGSTIDATSAEESIVNGSTDTTHLGVVKLLNARGEYRCTGTVVKRDGAKQLAWIVTSATCAGAVSKVDLVTTAGATSRTDIIRTHIHSNPSDTGQDVAVLVANGAPTTTAIVLLPTSTDDDIGALRSITLVGFGVSVRGDATTDEVRRFANKTVLTAGSKTFNWTQAPGTGAACDGDLGGAVIRNSKLVGVITGGAGCAGLGQQGLAQRLKFTRAFIDDKLNDTITFTCGECRASESRVNPAYSRALDSTAIACNNDRDCMLYTRCSDVTCATVAPAERNRCVDQCTQGFRYDLEFENYQNARCAQHCQVECTNETLCLID